MWQKKVILHPSLVRCSICLRPAAVIFKPWFISKWFSRLIFWWIVFLDQPQNNWPFYFYLKTETHSRLSTTYKSILRCKFYSQWYTYPVAPMIIIQKVIKMVISWVVLCSELVELMKYWNTVIWSKCALWPLTPSLHF